MPFIDSQRGKTRKIETVVSEEELAEYFKHLLHGTDIEPNPNREEIAENLEEIDPKEVAKSIDGLKKRKAAGIDGIKAEALIEGKELLINYITEIFSNCLKLNCIPEEFRRTRYWPIYKKGDRSKPENYRGIAISNVIMKLWSQIIAGRLQAEVEDKNILPDSQAGFRRNRSTMDNIYILDTIVNEKLRK